MGSYFGKFVARIAPLCSALLLLGSWGPVQADILGFKFSDGAGNAGVGLLTSVDQGGGNFLATDGTLVVTGGAAVGAYSLFPGGPGTTFTPSGSFFFDDLVMPGSNPVLSLGGLLFEGSGLESNIYSTGPGNYHFDYFNGATYTLGPLGGTFNLVTPANFAFTFSDSAGDIGSGTLLAIDQGGTFLAVGGMLFMTGGGGAGTYSLIAGGPGTTFTPSGSFFFDDLVMPGSNPVLSLGGLLFEGSGLESNIYSSGPDNSYHFDYFNGVTYTLGPSDGVFMISSVSEPSTTLLLALGSLGLFWRRRLSSVKS